MKIDKTTLNVTSHGFLFKAESTQDDVNSFELECFSNCSRTIEMFFVLILLSQLPIN